MCLIIIIIIIITNTFFTKDSIPVNPMAYGIL